MNFTYSTSQFGPATLHVPSCLTWLVETVQCYTWGRRKFPSTFCAEFFLRWKGLGKRVGGKHGTQTSLHWHLLPNSFFMLISTRLPKALNLHIFLILPTLWGCLKHSEKWCLWYLYYVLVGYLFKENVRFHCCELFLSATPIFDIHIVCILSENFKNLLWEILSF